MTVAGRYCFILLTLLVSGAVPAGGATVADHFCVAEFSSLTDSVIAQIETELNFYYVHTSHGSQIMTGLSLVYAEDSRFDPPYFYEVGDDLGHNGDTSWAAPTRTYLASHADCNVVMYSWCGGCSDNTETGINIYLNKMIELEAEFPSVRFIYMTGHLDGTGPTGNLYARNNQIRAFCTANDKVLFDFADIESYDPAGTWYPDETDACNWCADWCASYTCPTCSCAHSHCFNCYQKGKAFWWLMTQLVGWTPEECCEARTGDVDMLGPYPNEVDSSDLGTLVNFLFSPPGSVSLPCRGEANVDAAGTPPTEVDSTDLGLLVNFLFSAPGSVVLPNCP
jgi:hypothetical protein